MFILDQGGPWSNKFRWQLGGPGLATEPWWDRRKASPKEVLCAVEVQGFPLLVIPRVGGESRKKILDPRLREDDKGKVTLSDLVP